jgi:hypothetical protein
MSHTTKTVDKNAEISSSVNATAPVVYEGKIMNNSPEALKPLA